MRRRMKRGALAHGSDRTIGSPQLQAPRCLRCERQAPRGVARETRKRPCIARSLSGDIDAMPPAAELVADKAYDSEALRERLAELLESRLVIHEARQMPLGPIPFLTRPTAGSRNPVEPMFRPPQGNCAV